MPSRVVLVIGLTVFACDPKGDGATATVSGGSTGATTSTASSGASSGATSSAPTTGVATTGGWSSTTGSTGGGVPELCTCDGGDCSLSPDLCATVEAYSAGSPIEIADVAALQCALAALRERTPGDIGWAETTCTDGPCGEFVRLRILADGTVLRFPSLETIFCVSEGPDTHDTLKEPAYFEGCAMMPEPGDRYACMIDATASELAECAPSQNC